MHLTLLGILYSTLPIVFLWDRYIAETPNTWLLVGRAWVQPSCMALYGTSFHLDLSAIGGIRWLPSICDENYASRRGVWYRQSKIECNRKTPSQPRTTTQSMFFNLQSTSHFFPQSKIVQNGILSKPSSSLLPAPGLSSTWCTDWCIRFCCTRVTFSHCGLRSQARWKKRAVLEISRC